MEIAVRLTPRGGADTIEGVDEDSSGRQYLKARVRAVPEKGAANAALARLLASRLGIGVSRVEIVSGATARLKIVRITGDARDLSQALAELARQG